MSPWFRSLSYWKYFAEYYPASYVVVLWISSNLDALGFRFLKVPYVLCLRYRRLMTYRFILGSGSSS